jgi:hypothetical protein
MAAKTPLDSLSIGQQNETISAWPILGYSFRGRDSLFPQPDEDRS